MGYYTRFNLSVDDINNDILTKIIEEDEDLIDIFDQDGDSFDEYKWYKHEEDIAKISKKYPDVVFTLKGEGEEAGDIWVKYFKNGKIQRCQAKITFDEYDETKLGAV
jgi:hypothetical protein